MSVSAVADFDGKAGGLGSPTCRGDVDDTLANFSNFGPAVDIAAPGVCIDSTYKNGDYASISGTSMAAPHAAGAVALYLHANGLDPATNGAGVNDIEAAILGAALPQSHPCGYTNERGSNEPLLFVNDLVHFQGNGECDVAGASSNNAPVANGVDMGTVLEDSSNNPWSPSVSDPDVGDILTCSITTQPANGIASVASDCSFGSYAPDPDFNGPDPFTYQVSDGVATDSGSVTVTVSPVNDTPVDHAGAAQTVGVGDTVQLDGSGSSDVDGDTLTYAWSITSKPATSSAALSNSTIVNPTFVADVEGTYVMELVVNDGTVNSAPDSVTITATAAAPGDTVTITKAVYNSKKNGGELKVEVTSSASTGDPATSPTLQITHFDGVPLATPIDMTYNAKKDKYTATVSLSPKPGETATVTSSLGGSATRAVGGK